MTALADRVKESTTTTGTGSLTLAGAVAQFESFNTAFGTANPFYYVITDANGTDWEVGTGELSDATTLVRTTVHQSSNGDAKINLSAGTHTVFCSAPAVFLADLASKTGKLSQFAATTSAELAGVISDETGSGALVFATSPALTTPSLGVATATSVNGTTIPSSKTLVVTTDKLSALAATTSAELAGVISDETGSGALVFATSPSLTTPNIGAATATSVNGTTIPSSKTLVVTTDKLSALAATTSSELAGVISDETGSGALVFATSPTLTTPNIGAATATSVNGTTIPSSKTLVVTTDKLSALAATTSAELAGVISDETGTGSLVFATSPALTTPNLGTPSAGTLSNCTGLPVGGVSGLGTGVSTALAVNTGTAGAFVVNGGALGTPSSGTVTNLTGTASININGTVGATTANTGAFTTLSASGVATFSAGTVTAPAITTSGDTNNGIYFPAADNVAITTGGTQRLLVDSSGNVGIGTSSPPQKTTVWGGGTLPSAISNCQLLVGDTSGFANAGLALTAASGNAESIFFGSTSSPTLGQIEYDNTNNYLRFLTNSTERMRIDSSGKLLVGTSTASSSANVTQVLYKTGDNYLQIASGTTGGGLLGQTGANMLFYTYTGAVGSESFTERMRINSDGNLGVGTTGYSNVRLNVVGSNTTSANYAIYAENSSNSLLLAVRNDGAVYAPSWYSSTSASAANVYVDSYGVLYRSTSSLRYKSDVQNATHGLEEVLKLRSVTYRGKSDGEQVFGGLIAEEVDAAGLKEFVVYDKEGQPDGLHYGHMVALLTKAIQEQQQQIDALKAEVAALKGNA